MEQAQIEQVMKCTWHSTGKTVWQIPSDICASLHPIRDVWAPSKRTIRRFCMRQLLALSVLLLGVTWAAAQNYPSQTSPSQTTPSHKSSNSGGQTSVQGCLSGSDGNYTLTDKNGTTYQLMGDTSKLSEHVGHEVKITGTAAASSSGAASESGAAHAGAASQTLQVSSVKHIAKS